jgi:hypothetical protein
VISEKIWPDSGETLQSFPRSLSSAILCFEELHIALQRVKAIIEDCSNGSKMWLLTLEPTTLLNIFPLKEVDQNNDVEELIILIRNQLRS